VNANFVHEQCEMKSGRLFIEIDFESLKAVKSSNLTYVGVVKTIDIIWLNSKGESEQ